MAQVVSKVLTMVNGALSTVFFNQSLDLPVRPHYLTHNC
jgi:hypothetical protein